MWGDEREMIGSSVNFLKDINDDLSIKVFTRVIGATGLYSGVCGVGGVVLGSNGILISDHCPIQTSENMTALQYRCNIVHR